MGLCPPPLHFENLGNTAPPGTAWHFPGACLLCFYLQKTLATNPSLRSQVPLRYGDRSMSWGTSKNREGLAHSTLSDTMLKAASWRDSLYTLLTSCSPQLPCCPPVPSTAPRLDLLLVTLSPFFASKFMVLFCSLGSDLSQGTAFSPSLHYSSHTPGSSRDDPGSIPLSPH